ncbi:MAG: aldose 1-epimerase family protein [Synergistaceae bacterium]|nr:aldose 1-epimerase family protein [Synergistaceae bacterium]
MDMKKFRAYVGNSEQVCGVRRVILDEGKARGISMYQVTTSGGLELDILPDSALDIGHLRYKGVNISYTTKNGYDSPAKFQPIAGEFGRYFPGGMLFTCGLLSAGPENTDSDGTFHPLHGRFHGIGAQGLCGYVDGENIIVGGEIRETAQGGYCFSVRRKYTIPAFGSEILLEDEITNLTPAPAEYMMLYHMNFGWPMLSESASLDFPEKRKVTPRTPYAEKGLKNHTEFCAPIDGEEEQVFFHEMENEAFVRLKNPELGITAEISWSLDSLPILAEWKNMASGDYVLGLEPSTCYIMGRERECREGRMTRLEPYGSMKNSVRLKLSGDVK